MSDKKVIFESGKIVYIVDDKILSPQSAIQYLKCAGFDDDEIGDYLKSLPIEHK